MAIADKASFLRSVEKDCAEDIPQNIAHRVMSIIANILERFDMREVAMFEADAKDDLLGSFISSLQIQGRSKLTIERYERMIKKFMSFVKTTTRQVSVYHVRGWLAAEKERGLKDSSLEGMRQILSSYFGWLFRENLIERNPMVNIGPIKVPKIQKKIITDIEMERLKQACDKMPGIKKFRNRAIILFLASTGCRISEMIGLNRDSVDLNNLECVVHGKGKKERIVYLDAITGAALKTYLGKRKDSGEALFVGKMGRRLMSNGVRVMLNALAEAAGTEHIHPHKFRRTKATDLARRGMPIQEVASILGHEKIDTTMEYVILDHDTIKASYRRFA